ncbi:MAG: hypothetical protein N2C14_05565 [Planctomycetales bacterium]
MELNVRDVRQGASGGSYLVKYRAKFEITADPGVEVTIGSIHPMSEASYASSAAEAIRMGFEEVLTPRNQGASVTVYDLSLHPVDFVPTKFMEVTANFLRELLDEESGSIR